jgi:phage protein U
MALLTWGDYSFEVGGTSFEKLRHRFGGRWSKPPVFGRRPPGQYLGPGEEEVTLHGTIYPVDMGHSTFDQIVAMQSAAGNGTVDMLFSGAGDAMGLFRLDDVDYETTNFLRDGTPQKVDYTLKFTAAEDSGGSIYAVWPA